MTRSLLIAFALFFFWSPVQAKGPFDTWLCKSWTRDTKVRMDACNDVIRSGEQNDTDLSIYYRTRGDTYSELGQKSHAIEDYNQAIRLDPNNAEAYYNRGVVYAGLGEYSRALQNFEQTIQLVPNEAKAYHSRGLAYARLGQNDRAIEDYDQAIRLDRNFSTAYFNRSVTYGLLRQSGRALLDFDQAIHLNPNYAEAYGYKAWILATSLSRDLRNGAQAVEAAQRADQMLSSYFSRVILAAAYAEAGQFSNAVREQESAIDMLKAAGERDQAAAYESRLDLYRQRKPYRE